MIKISLDIALNKIAETAFVDELEKISWKPKFISKAVELFRNTKKHLKALKALDKIYNKEIKNVPNINKIPKKEIDIKRTVLPAIIGGGSGAITSGIISTLNKKHFNNT